MKKIIRITENELKNIIYDTINEISYKTYANAASIAKSRENQLKASPDYPQNALRKTHMKDGTIDTSQLLRNIKYRKKQETQPETFYNAAYTALSREICGEDNFYEFLRKYISKYGADYKIQTMMKKYKEGEEYIMNNPSGWSDTTDKSIGINDKKEKFIQKLRNYLRTIWQKV